MITKEVHRTLYDSCDIYANAYLANRMRVKIVKKKKKNENCPGDEGILELCSKCPFYAKKEVQNGR